LQQLLINRVAVEKLFPAKTSENKIASQCVIGDLLESQDIFYPPKFWSFGAKREFFNSHMAITLVEGF